VTTSGVLEGGLDTCIGPPSVLGHREGKEAMLVEDQQDKLLKGGNSKWATCGDTPMVQRINEENCVISEENNISVEDGTNDYVGDMLQAGRRKPKEGCNKLPLFFGPNKWAQYTNAKKIHGGSKNKKRKGSKKKKVKGNAVLGDSQDEEIQNESSETTGENDFGGTTVQQFIPISNIQIVLNEGEECRPQIDDHGRQIRIEAERLFHIGLNLGITSNEERLTTLERMVELEVGDEAKFVEEGGEEEVQ
jgi:hypothetical protein